MAIRRRKFAKKRRSTFKRRVAKRRVAKRPALKRMIRREIARNVENKRAQYYNYDKRLYATGNVSFPTDNIFPVCVDPNAIVINQGVGQGQRVGNTIKTKKLVFKGTIVPFPYDATFNPQPLPMQGKMYIFYDKTEPTDVPNPQAAADFFQNGNTTKGFQNDLADMWSPVNTDRYRILAVRHFKVGYQQYTGTGSIPTQGNFANNDFKMNVNFNIDLTRHHPKIVKFNDTLTTPTTRGVYCMVQYVWANGGAMPTTNYSIGMQYMLDYQYEDA